MADLQPLSEKKSRVARALEIFHKRYDLVFSHDKQPYAVDRSTGNPQTYRIGSSGFESVLRRLCYIQDRNLVLTQEDTSEGSSQLGALAELYRWLMERRRRRIAEYMAGPYLLKREEALQRDRAKFRDARLS